MNFIRAELECCSNWLMAAVAFVGAAARELEAAGMDQSQADAIASQLREAANAVLVAAVQLIPGS